MSLRLASDLQVNAADDIARLGVDSVFIPPTAKFAWSITARTVDRDGSALRFSPAVFNNTLEDGGLGGPAGIPLRAYMAGGRLVHPCADAVGGVVGRIVASAVDGDRLVGGAAIVLTAFGREVVELLSVRRALSALDAARRAPSLSLVVTTFHVAGEFIEFTAEAADLVDTPSLPGVFIPV